MGKKGKQIAFVFRTHGGARRGAGRKRVAPKSRVLHRPRARLTGREPVLVTLTTQPSLANLRNQAGNAAHPRQPESRQGAARVRIVHYSVQRDPIAQALSRKLAQLREAGPLPRTLRELEGR